MKDNEKDFRFFIIYFIYSTKELFIRAVFYRERQILRNSKSDFLKSVIGLNPHYL